MEKIVQESERITQVNSDNRNFINDSIYNNEEKLLCSKCIKQSSNNYINKYSNIIKCKNCVKQIEQPI